MRQRRAIMNRRAPAALYALLFALLLAVPALASTPSFPSLTGRVVDDANILSPETRANLTAILQRHEQATGEQVVVVTLPSLQGYSIEDFGYQLGRYWGIGQKDKNTGALLIVAPKEHKVRVEVGYGLEGKLTDAQSSVIINRDILPEFRRGDFNAGVMAGTATILKVLGGDAAAAEPSADESEVAANNFANSPWVVPAFFILFMLVMFLLAYLRNRHNPNVIRRVGRSGGFFGGGGDMFSGGGGGFSGGGGSFGGGGASGSW
jgi:uncharacterized protein